MVSPTLKYHHCWLTRLLHAGLSWVLAFFAISDARLIFQYLLSMTTAFQGLFIFLIFPLRDATVVAFWRQLFRDGRQQFSRMANNAACCRAPVGEESVEMSDVRRNRDN